MPRSILFPKVEVDQVGIGAKRFPHQSFNRIRLHPVIGVQMEDIVSRSCIQSGLAGPRKALVGLGNDPHSCLQLRILPFQDAAQDLHRPVLAAIIHKKEFDGGIGLGKQAFRTAGDIVLHPVHRDNDGDQRGIPGSVHNPRLAKRSGIRTMSTNSIIPGLFQA